MGKNVNDLLNDGSMNFLLDSVKKNVYENLKVSDICLVESILSDNESNITEEVSPITDVSSSGWIERTNINGIKYGESAASYYWDSSINPNANFNYCLPNCTTYAYGRVLEAGCEAAVSAIHNAKNWHNYLTNGWQAINYSEDLVGMGDILEWTEGSAGHVAIVEHINPIMISASDYTDDSCGWPLSGHRTPGISWGGSPYPISSISDISRWLSMKAPNRFFRYGTLSNECSRAGAYPVYILKNPGNFFNNTRRQYYCRSITTGLNCLCYCSRDLKIAPNDTVVVLFTDRDFRVNLTKIKNQEEVIYNTNNNIKHSESYGVIIAKI